MSHPRHHITEREDDAALVRRCLREFAKGLQRQGEIPPDVSGAELYAEVERYVSTILTAAQRNAMYHEWKDSGHLEEHLRFLIRQMLNTPQIEPAAASDQISYVHAPTGKALTPSWKHRNCGGTVYMSERDAFRCNACKKTGALGVEFTREMTRQEQKEYLLTHVEEVELI